MQLPSPIHEVSYNGFSIYVKRDDLIDPFISGNKWRKLKYIIQKATTENKQHLVTFGGAYSNHLLATAAASAQYKFKASAFVRGEEVTNEMLMLCKLFGMHLIFIDRERYRNKPQLFEEYFAGDDDAYYIDEGGASLEATLGCAEIIEELTQDFDHIFCAAGTGTTAAGLLNGINISEKSTSLNVIPVLKGGDFIKDEIAIYAENLSKLQLFTTYHFGGYAKTTPQLLQFIKDFTAQTGILIDPVYTAKMFYAIFDLLAKDILKENEKILALHTGGLFGLLGMKDKINSIF
jgi:1-aminocyclopropane-1-carboxylate deaminase